MDIRKLEKGRINTKTAQQPGTVPGRLHSAPADIGSAETNTNTENTSDLTTKEENNPEDYLDFLKEHDVDEAQILAALDALIVQGYFSWEFKLFGKVSCEFQTRPQWVEQLVILELEKQQPKTFAHFTGLLNFFNLAGSIKKLGDSTFSPEDEEGLYEVMEYLRKLPSITITRLTAQLVIFDRLIQAASSDWAVENLQ